MVLRFPGARNCRIVVTAAVMTVVPVAAFAQNNTQVVPPPKAQKKLPEAPSKLPKVGADRIRVPRHVGALAGLGMVMQDIGDERRALEAFRKALAVNPHLEKVPELVKTLTEKVEGRDI